MMIARMPVGLSKGLLFLFFAWMVAAPVSNAEYNARMHVNQPASESSYHYVFARYFEERAKEYTNGEFGVTIFPGAQLGGDPAVFQQMQLGAIQAGVFAFPNLVEFFPAFNLFALPFLFEDFDSAAIAFQGPTAEDLYAQFEERTGIKVLGVFNGGFRGITNNVRPIENIEDFAGLTIRVPGSPMLISTLESLGIRPVSISGGEIFTALQLGTVDGQESTVSWGFGQGFADVQRYLTETRHAVTGTGLYINSDFFYGLPDDTQRALLRAAEEAVEHVNEVTKQYDRSVVEQYQKAGLEVTVIDLEEMRPLVADIWEEYAPQVGGIEVIEALVQDGQR